MERKVYFFTKNISSKNGWVCLSGFLIKSNVLYYLQFYACLQTEYIIACLLYYLSAFQLDKDASKVYKNISD